MGSRLGILFMPFLTWPMLMAQKGVKWYWCATLVSNVLFSFVTVAWLLMPYALFVGLGPTWVLLWLIPTSASIFMIAFLPRGGG